MSQKKIFHVVMVEVLYVVVNVHNLHQDMHISPYPIKSDENSVVIIVSL